MTEKNVKWVRTKLSPELHGELKKECAISGETMQNRVADLIADNLDNGDRNILALRLAELTRSELEAVLKTAKKIRNKN